MPSPSPLGASAALTLTDPQVAGLLRDHYDVRTERLTSLRGEAAAVHRVDCAGESMAFKAFEASPEVLARVRWQAGVQAHLYFAGLPVPALRPNRLGENVTEIEVDGHPVAVQVSDWIRGLRLADVPSRSKRLLDQLGATTAALSEALSAVRGPGTEVAHEWDLRRAATMIEAAVPYVRDRVVAGVVSQAAAVLQREVVPLLPLLPEQVVHQDLNDFNIMIDPQTETVVGIVDFDDMLVGLRVAEPVIAGAYASRAAEDPLATVTAVLAAHHCRLPLTPAEMRVALPLAAARLATNIAIWAQRSTGPRAIYAAERAVGSSRALRVLLAGDVAAFEARLGGR